MRPEHRAALSVVSRTAYVLEERAFAREKQVWAERLAQRQALGHRLGAVSGLSDADVIAPVLHIACAHDH